MKKIKFIRLDRNTGICAVHYTDGTTQQTKGTDKTRVFCANAWDNGLFIHKGEMYHDKECYNLYFANAQDMELYK